MPIDYFAKLFWLSYCVHYSLFNSFFSEDVYRSRRNDISREQRNQSSFLLSYYFRAFVCSPYVTYVKEYKNSIPGETLTCIFLMKQQQIKGIKLETKTNLNCWFCNLGINKGLTLVVWRFGHDSVSRYDSFWLVMVLVRINQMACERSKKKK